MDFDFLGGQHKRPLIACIRQLGGMRSKSTASNVYNGEWRYNGGCGGALG